VIQLSPEDEKRLVQQLKRGSNKAFTEFVRLYQTPVFHLAHRILGRYHTEAIDACQDIFVTVFRAIPSFRGDSRLSTWVYRIAVNTCRNRLKYHVRRHSGRHEPYDEATSAPSTTTRTSGSAPARPDRQAEANEAERFLQHAVEMIPDNQREILVLRDIEGLSYDEIATITNLATGTVKSRLHRARDLLQRAYVRWRESYEK
jgi:RNA polymerase sigma-70 factor (ECF subfamily)